MAAFEKLGITLFGFLTPGVFVSIFCGCIVVAGICEAVEQERGPIPVKAIIIYSLLTLIGFMVVWASIFLHASWYLASGTPTVILTCLIIRWCNPMDERLLFSRYHIWFNRLFIRRSRTVSIFSLFHGAFLLLIWIRLLINSSGLPPFVNKVSWLVVGAVTGAIIGVGIGTFREYIDGRAPAC